MKRNRPGRKGVSSISLPALLLFLLLSSSVGAQTTAPKWGFIEAADLEMTSWPDDPDATAAVLADVGEVYFTGNFEQVFKRYCRVKILSEAAYDRWGTVKIPYYSKGGSQKIELVQGITTIRQDDGSDLQIPLGKESIFDEDANRSFRQIRFTMPALKPGCIIEYRYTIRSLGVTHLNPWEFATDQPTRWSEFVATIPGNLDYIMIRRGLISFSSETTETADWPSQLDGFERALKYNVKQIRHRWAMKNVPAIRDEPFITMTSDYVPRIRFQLAHWSWPGEAGVDYIKDWKTVAEGVSEGTGSCPAAEGLVKKLVAGAADPTERMRRIYQFVRRTMVWDRGLGRSDDLCKAFKARKGGSDDIATLLTSMLRKADLDALPVLVSTRSNGKPIDSYPLVSQFNRTLTLVTIGDQEYVLDASDPLRPMDVLPLAALNETGFVVDPGDPRWVDIPSGLDRSDTEVTATLVGGVGISGVLEASATGYAALDVRHKLREESEKQYLDRVWLPRFHTGTIDSATISNKDSAEVPLITTLRFSGAGSIGEGAHRIYFEPVLVKAVEENPFRNPRRILPVDFGYRTERIYSLTLNLPEGYALETVPPDVNVVLPDNGGHLTRRIETTPGQVRLTREFVLARPRYGGNDIKALRSCYDRLMALDSEQIVLIQHPSTKAEGRN